MSDLHKDFLDMEITQDPQVLDAKEFTDIDPKCPVAYHKSWEVIDSTKLSDARRCLRRFMLAHIFGWKPTLESNHLTFGRAWHVAKEHLRLEGIDPETIEAAFQKFLEVYREEYPPETDEDFGAKTPSNAALALGQYAQRYGVEIDTTLHTEIADYIPISENRRMAFKLDAIMQNQFKQKYVVDDKTGGEMSNRWIAQWALSGQLSGYYHIMRMIWPAAEVVPGYVDGAIFRKMGNDFVRVPIHRSDEALDAWLWQTNWWWDQIAFSLEDLLERCTPDDRFLAAFPWNEEGCSKYTGCEFHDVCINVTNPLAYYKKDTYLAGRPEAPPGFKVEFWNPFEVFTEAKPLSAFGLEIKGRG